MTKFCLVTNAVENREMADRLAHHLVELQLAACVQVTPIHSTYHWRGKVEAAEEYLLVIKTLTRKYTQLEKAIRDQHSYEIPEILRMRVDGGFRPYLEWMEENVE